MIDYTYFYKTQLPLDKEWLPEKNEWDVFLSAYTQAERVKHVFDKITAGSKHWLVAPEYGFKAEDVPDDAHLGESKHEAELVQGFLESVAKDFCKCTVCVDTTGFIRPHLMFLMRLFWERGVHRFDALYSEPGHYRKREHTEFSKGSIGEVRQVAGFEGTHNPDSGSDVLIIGSGYDHELIAQVAENKDHARKIQMFGLPSLRADMFQENILRATLAEDAVGSKAGDEESVCFAPSNDPFVTAAVLQEVVGRIEARQDMTNLYLSPLATKPQTIGFALYYLAERSNGPTSIIFPFRDTYSKETTTGISRVWKYTVELDAVQAHDPSA